MSELSASTRRSEIRSPSRRTNARRLAQSPSSDVHSSKVPIRPLASISIEKRRSSSHSAESSASSSSYAWILSSHSHGSEILGDSISPQTSLEIGMFHVEIGSTDSDWPNEAMWARTETQLDPSERQPRHRSIVSPSLRKKSAPWRQ